MKYKYAILALLTTLGFSTLAIAKNKNDHRYNGYNNHSDRNYDSRHRGHDNHNRNRIKHPKKYKNKHKNKHYYNSHNYSGFNSPYRNGHRGHNNHRNYNGHRGYNRHRNHNYYGNRHNYSNYYNRYYSNYRPYYEDRYRYRPLRGLGHYFHRTGYGYGHWHDNSWCVVNHPQSYYYDYYSNYPYQNGWNFGDGDFGISFYFN